MVCERPKPRNAEQIERGVFYFGLGGIALICLAC